VTSTQEHNQREKEKEKPKQLFWKILHFIVKVEQLIKKAIFF
jgi:hypothetical protein